MATVVNKLYDKKSERSTIRNVRCHGNEKQPMAKRRSFGDVTDVAILHKENEIIYCERFKEHVGFQKSDCPYVE